mmetsp:Transcript_32462/g.81959  ORF Transcript_32462/g.81959 Transcript_32462/m.81959 type:complete len:278 (-) Transcript_32462:436-1269(-)
MHHMAQACVHGLQVLEARGRSGVRQRGGDGLGTRLADRPGSKPRDGGVVGNHLGGCLGGVHRRALPRGVRLKGVRAQWRQRQVPALPIGAINGCGGLGSIRMRRTTSKLWRQVVHVGVVVGARADVRRSALHRLKPPAHGGPALRVTHTQTLVVQQRGVHALQERREVHVHQADVIAHEVGAPALRQLRLHRVQHLAEARFAGVVAPVAGEPLHPGAEQRALQAVEQVGALPLRAARRRQQRPLWEHRLQLALDGRRVGDHLPVDLCHWHLPRRHHA